MKTRNIKWKAPMVVFTIFVVFIFVLYIQYLYLSLSPSVYGIDMKEFASNRNTYYSTLYSKRGTIYDSDGNALALDVSSYTVIAYLDESRTGSSTTLYHVKDKQKTAEALSPLLNMSVESLLELLNKDKYQVELGPGGRGITELLKNKIEELNLPGIDFIESYKRYYPNGDFASYIIGYAKKKDVQVVVDNITKTENIIVGELGIEVKFDDILKGINGYTKYQQDRYGYKIPDTKEETLEASDGSDIYLTLDSNIQRIIESSVDDIVTEYNPDFITISVMDAKTGDILGSAATPSFDPNILNITNYENPLTSFVYEPGSVMKIYTYMCALEKGTYDGSATYPSGYIEIEDTKIYDWNKKGWGEISYDYGFEMSSNVGVSYIMQNFINKEDLKTCLTSYGFGTKTGINLPREMNGNIVFNYPVEVAAASYGQGISTTAIQQLQALSIIANDGYMVTPQIISKVVKDDKVTYERKIIKSNKIVSSETIEYIKDLMYKTVNDVEGNATGIGYRIEGLDVIGKTGTAQIYDEINGGYLTGSTDNLYSFAGMFPKDDPEIIIFVSVKRPNVASNSAIRKLTKPVIEAVAKYRGLLGSNANSDSQVKVKLENYVNKNTNDVIENLEKNNLEIIKLGDGDRIIKQYPSKDTTLLSGDKVYLVTNDKDIRMPSLIGYTRIEAIALLNLLDINYNIEGYGTVVEQSVEEGSLIEKNIKLILKEEIETD